MKISDLLQILEREKVLGRTPKGNPMTQYAIDVISSIIEDEKNYHIDAVQCLNCGLIISSAVSSENCPNCGNPKMTFNIEKID